jgi:hypothetical protein
MADTPPIPSSSPDASAPTSSVSEQARIRKERREAKIRAGGSARLNKITGLGGGVQRGMPSPFPSIFQNSGLLSSQMHHHHLQPQPPTQTK